MQLHLVLVLQRSGLKFIIVVAFEGDGEAGAGSVVTALYQREGQLSLDEAFLDAAQQFGLEIHLHGNDWSSSSTQGEIPAQAWWDFHGSFNQCCWD